MEKGFDPKEVTGTLRISIWYL